MAETMDRIILTLAGGHAGADLQVSLARYLHDSGIVARHLFTDKDSEEIRAVRENLGSFLTPQDFRAVQLRVQPAQRAAFGAEARQLQLNHITPDTNPADHPGAIRLWLKVNLDELKRSAMALLPRDHNGAFRAQVLAVVLWAPSGPTSSLVAVEGAPGIFGLLVHELQNSPRINTGKVSLISIAVHPPDPTVGESMRKVNTAHAIRAMAKAREVVAREQSQGLTPSADGANHDE